MLLNDYTRTLVRIGIFVGGWQKGGSENEVPAGRKETTRDNWYLSSVAAVLGRPDTNEITKRVWRYLEGKRSWLVDCWKAREMFYWFNIRDVKPVWDPSVQSARKHDWPVGSPHASPATTVWNMLAGYLHRTNLSHPDSALRSPL